MRLLKPLDLKTGRTYLPPYELRSSGAAATLPRERFSPVTQSGHLSAVELQAQSRNPLAGDCSLTGVRNNRERWLLWGPEFVWSFPCLMRGR